LDLNLSHVERGREFQERVRRILEGWLEEPVETEVLLPVGDPPKLHRFDLASRSRSHVCECKSFTWTAGGNVPSAKITTLREAAQFLAALQEQSLKIIAMKRSLDPRRKETLAEYFCRLNAHLLGSISVLEVGDDGSTAWLRGGLSA
jgi:hypothetical protein